MSSDALKSDNSSPFILQSSFLKQEALRLGFSHCGVAPAEPVSEAFMENYEKWLRRGWQGEMHYLENYLALRRDLRLLLEGAKTVVSLAMSYNPGTQPTQPGIAWYAQGKDYHEVVKERAHQLLSTVLNAPKTPKDHKDFKAPKDFNPQFRICVDTAPIMEKYWAWRCGLGWIGRHTQLDIPHEGSAFFLAEILLTCEADKYDEPIAPLLSPNNGEAGGMGRQKSLPLSGGAGGGLCGACHRCIDACPTHALTDEGIDARLCLSYLTIEHRGALPKEAASHLHTHFYGCDRCLRACPHLSHEATSVEDFHPSPELLSMTPDDWASLTPEQYRQLFRGSAVKRAKYEGLMRNIEAGQED